MAKYESVQIEGLDALAKIRARLHEHIQLQMDESQVKKLLKTPLIFKQYIAMENELKFNENPENAMEILINNYYFSIYTQKFFISSILLSFINKENPEKIHGLVNFFENNYPSNKKLLFLKVLALISYYESISPILYLY